MRAFNDFSPRMSRDFADNLNEVVEAVESLTRMGAGSITGEGLPEENPPPIYPLARITGVTRPSGTLDILWQYSGNYITTDEGTPDTNGNYIPIFVDALDSITGNPIPFDFPLIERTNNSQVPINGSVIVKVEPGPGDLWVFDFPVPAPLTVYARFATQSLPAYTNTLGVLNANANGALTSAYCDDLTPVQGDIVLFCVEGSSSANYAVYEITEIGGASAKWLLTPTNPWIIQAAAQVFIGPEGTNDKNTVWQVATPNPINEYIPFDETITTTATPIKFRRIIQEVRIVKRVASAGTGWDTTSSTSATLGTTTSFTVGTGLNLAALDVLFMNAGSGNTQVAIVGSYNSGTGALTIGSITNVTGTVAAYSSWTITTTKIQGYYPGGVYFQDKTSDANCWIGDMNGNIPTTDVFYKATRNFNKTLDGITRGFYETEVSGPVVTAVSAACVAGDIATTVTTGNAL